MPSFFFWFAQIKYQILKFMRDCPVKSIINRNVTTKPRSRGRGTMVRLEALKGLKFKPDLEDVLHLKCFSL